MSVITKICKKCNIEKVKTEYNLDKKGAYGIRSVCKECVKEHYKNNKEKLLAATRLWYSNNKEKVSEQKKLYGINNKEKIAEKNKLWYEANKSESKEKSALYYQNNSEEAKRKARLWYENNKEKVYETGKEWKANNHEKRVNYEIKRRARAIGTLSKGLIDKLYKLQKGKCPCCRLPLGKDFHVDHILPLALNGTNTDDNIQLLRKSCNLQKSAKDPFEFMQSRGYLL